MKSIRNQLRITTVFICVISSIGFFRVSSAEDVKGNIPASVEQSAQQKVFIDPTTGKIIPAPAAEGIPTQTQVKEVSVPPQEKVYYQADGSIRIDLNGKYMMPLYGRINPDDSLSLSHGPAQEGKK